jgi:hypothetical protein
MLIVSEDPIHSPARAGQSHPLQDRVVIRYQAEEAKEVPEALPEDHIAILPTRVEVDHPLTVAVADLHPQAQEALPVVVVLQDRTEEGNLKQIIERNRYSFRIGVEG